MSSHLARLALRVVLVGLALVGASRAGAQTPTEGHEQEPVRTARPKTFPLFGLADFAITGMRQGGRTSWKTTASGPSDDDPTLDADLPGRVIGTVSSPNGYCCGYFELQLWMASARGDWSRARDIIPSLENVRGGGWNTRTQLSRWVSNRDQLAFTGRDGSIGTLFSGVTSTDDGSCRDNSRRANSFIGNGMQLLAGSDCPPTWANPSRFDGERVVPDTTWLRRFRAQGASFTFEDRQFTAAERDDARLYGAFQTFGATNDFGRETLVKAGNVIPGGTGNSAVEGFPMGIEWEWNAWSYAVPSLADAMFFKVNVVNRSSQVYGTGIDYDSLFLGYMVRPFHTTGTQAPAVYAALERGSVLSAQGNTNGLNCYGPAGGKTLGTNIRGCFSNTAANRGFRGGAGAIVIMKSPIGDLRNKLFTRPSSPFYMPSHPHAGDTLTYNIMTSCGFTCATQQITIGRTRASYGAIVGSEQDALAGRGITSGEFTETNYHNLFRNADWPTRWSPQTGTAGGFNRYLPPGGWDYDKDGKADTMKVTTCWTSATTTNYSGTPADGCVPPFADTLPGGFPNSFHNNYFTGVGPIKLAAGDTVSWVVAFVSVPDSISLERQVASIISLYENFWLSPQPPAPVQIVSASVVGGSRQFDTEVRLFFDQTANEQSDLFLIDAANRLKNSNDLADRRLRALNPSLANDILARALPVGRTLVDTVPRNSNQSTVDACRSAATYSATLCQIITTPTIGVVDSLFVFKSCDGGITFTATGGEACTPAPARDVATGNPSGYNWQSYARLGRDAAGQFPATFRDGNVTGGLTYTYIVIAQSFPASFLVVDSVGGAAVVREFLVRPKTQNGLSANTANRNVATVYVPASVQAGGATSGVIFERLVTQGVVTSDTAAAVSASIRLARPLRGEAPISGRAIFSDSAEVIVYDSDTTAAGIDSTVVRLFELVNDSLDANTVRRRSAGRVERFVVPGSAGVVDLGQRIAGTTVIRKDSAFGASSPDPLGKAVIHRYRVGAANRPQVTFVIDGRPLFVTDTVPSSTDLTPAATTAREDFLGALLTFNPSVAGTLRSTFWRAPGIPLLRSDASPTIRWIAGTSRDPAAFSSYEFEFVDTEFGPNAPFRYNRLYPDSVRNAYTASLQARRSAMTTATDSAAAAAISAVLGRTITPDSLAALELPFTVRNARFDRDVRVAVLKSTHPTSAVLGTTNDTVRVNVPSDRWIPGDQLYFIETLPTVAYDTLQASPLVRRVRRNASGVPDTVSTTRVTWGPTRLGCDVPASPVTPTGTCNPLVGFAGTGYTLARAGMEYDVQYYAPLAGLQELQFTLQPDVAGEQIASLTEGDLSLVRVVPNPYMMFSQYEQTDGTKRLMFIGLPPKGRIRIYTASGQFVQQITWVESDLERNCRSTTMTSQCIPTGDLQWDMRTREDKLIGPGFYVYVVSTDVGGGKREKLGKFVIIH